MQPTHKGVSHKTKGFVIRQVLIRTDKYAMTHYKMKICLFLPGKQMECYRCSHKSKLQIFLACTVYSVFPLKHHYSLQTQDELTFIDAVTLSYTHLNEHIQWCETAVPVQASSIHLNSFYSQMKSRCLEAVLQSWLTGKVIQQCSHLLHLQRTGSLAFSNCQPK